MLLTRRLQNDGAHASYRVHLKVRTIDSWLAERGTVNAIPNLRLHESFLAPFATLCIFSFQIQLPVQLQLLYTWIRLARSYEI